MASGATLQLLDAEAKVAASTFVRAGFGANDEGTKSFGIDSSGRHVIRLTVEGEETGTFCVLMGGTALPSAKATGCPATAPAILPPPARTAAAPVPVVAPAPAPPKAVEVITSKCEERLRVGSDFLFGFDWISSPADVPYSPFLELTTILTYRYRITAKGLRTAIFYTRLYNRDARDFTTANRELIIADAARHQLPAIYGARPFPEGGRSMAYGPDEINTVRRAAFYVDRILRVAKSLPTFRCRPRQSTSW